MLTITFISISFALWLAYVFIITGLHIYLGWSRTTRIRVAVLAAPLLVMFAVIGLAGLIMDVLYNITIGTVLFLDPPAAARETFTLRLKRYKHMQPHTALERWRHRAALWLCANLLDPFEKGGHCR